MSVQMLVVHHPDSGQTDGATELTEEAESEPGRAACEEEGGKASPGATEDGDGQPGSVEQTDSDVPEVQKDSDEEYDTDLETGDERRDYDPVCEMKRVYLELCERTGVVPASYFLRHVTSEVLDMSYHGLGATGARCIAIPLHTNTYVTQLSLEDNWLCGEGGRHIADMLKENCYISELNLANNKLGSVGAQAICEMLQENTTLKAINLAGNEFRDKDGQLFVDALQNNFQLKEVDLSGNLFSDGEHLGNAIAANDSVVHLDLSWNQLRGRGALAICNGLKLNTTLKSLDVSWNGFADEGALGFAEALKLNNVLTVLNITNNRITCQGATFLAKGVAENDTLKSLRVGKNPITMKGAMQLLDAVRVNSRTALELLDLTDVLLSLEFMQLLGEVLDKHADFRIKHGGVAGEIAQKIKRANPMLVLRDALRQTHSRLIDFFKSFDKEGDLTVTVEEFKAGLQREAIHLDPIQMYDLFRALDKDEDGMVNYGDLLRAEREMLLEKWAGEHQDKLQKEKESRIQDAVLKELS
ncbi:NLRC3 [Branchiostoma lanceolatum]|uniref:NLRC3 protein n=1 Tax=Branchiostoma lanceolatum TaxID=7740 RepID=A0A8J9ZXV1_BRALA|nr:NLRC3 [Branchiostoma lanceolatum]